MECEGTWQERPNLEAPEIPLLVCDGCGEMAVITKGRLRAYDRELLKRINQHCGWTM